MLSSPSLYWQRQLYSLCGVHCLNSLLQAPFFDQSQLASIAHQLDAQQKQLMSSEGVTTTEFLLYMAEDSGNVAEDGNYSIQVLEEALRRVGENVEENDNGNGDGKEKGFKIRSVGTYNSFEEFLNSQGFIMHLGAHWFAIRRIHGELYNLNSLFQMPQVIPKEYISNFFQYFFKMGCQMWVVKGKYPEVKEERYKDMNDNQMLVEIQKIHDYTEERMVENVVRWTMEGEGGMVDGAGVGIDGAGMHGGCVILGGGDAMGATAAAGVTGSTQQKIDGYSAALPSHQFLNKQKTQNPCNNQFSFELTPTINPSKPIPVQHKHPISPIPTPIPTPISTLPKSNYDKFDIADPLQSPQFFHFIRSQIASNLPVQPPSGITIHFHISDSQTITHKFSSTMKIEIMYDYVFVVLTAKPLKKKLKFWLQETQTGQILKDVGKMVGGISDLNWIGVRVREY